MNNKPQQDPPSTHQTPQSPVSAPHAPEHEPLSFHFGNFKEALSNIEHQEAQTPPENLPSPLANQPYTPPILQNASPQTAPTNVTALPSKPSPKLPLSDEDIEKNAHSKKSDDSVHWLALWCIRQLEMYEKSITKR